MRHFVIIGSGIIGSSIARELARRKLGQVTVLEKEASLGRHASGRNSGVIHSGINQKPGSLKARMCLEGSRRLRAFCRERGVPMNECGTLVVARNEAETQVLRRLLELGLQCNVPGLRMISEKEFYDREPSGNAIAALLSPTGATVDSMRLLQAVAEDAKSLGAEYRFGHDVQRIDGLTIETPAGKVTAEHIINCAGLYADKIAHQMGVGLDCRVIPFRGEYMEVEGCDVRSMIYQAPDLRFPFLSIHLTRETNGRVLAGPSAVLAFGREAYEKQWVIGETLEMLASLQFWRLVASPAFLRLAVQNAKTSLLRKAFLRQIQGLAPGIRAEQVHPARAGIRAQMVNRSGRMLDDILVEYREHSTHVLNAVSPGMTCSLAFAEHVVDRLSGKIPH